MAFNTTLKHFTSSQELASIWATGENYLLNQLVLENDVIYRCAIAHTSGATFATDLGAGKWVAVSAAGASGSKNYIENGDFEDNNTTGWSLFNTTIDSTTKIPTGTIVAGAAGFNALSVSGSSPLAGSYSLSVSTAAGVTITTTGYGFISDAFTIDREDQAKVMGFSFYYEAVSGTMNFSGTSSNTFAVYIRDVSGGAWIQPAGVYNLVQSSGSGICSGTFQTTATGTQYQIAVLMINTVSATVSMRFDDFQLGPQKVLAGAAISDWQSYTPTVSNATGISSLVGYYRRTGDTLHVRVSFVVDNIARSGTSQWRVSIPNNYSPNLSLVTDNGGTGVHGVYELYGDITGTTNQFVQTDVARVDGGGIALARRGSNRTLYDADFNSIGNAKYISIDIQFPISGWSSNTVMSQDTDTRVVALTATQNFGSGSISSTTLKWTGDISQTHGTYDSSTGIFTAPVPGYYQIESTIPFYSTADAQVRVTVQKNGTGSDSVFINRSNASQNAGLIAVSRLIYLNAGDNVRLNIGVDTGSPTYLNVGTSSTLAISRLSGPATIAASESVVVRAYASGGQTLTTSTSTIQYNNKTLDSHSAFNTSTYTFTAPISGTYLVSAKYYMSNSTPCYIGINGLNYSYSLDGDANGKTYQITDFIQLLAGQTVTIGGQAITGSGTLGAGAGSREHTLNIVRVGN